jgi:hypothetical protein
VGGRQHVCDVDGWKWRGSVSRSIWLSCEPLLFFCYKLVLDVIRNVVVALQWVTLLYKLDEGPEVMSSQPVMLLANWTDPAMTT